MGLIALSVISLAIGTMANLRPAPARHLHEMNRIIQFEVETGKYGSVIHL